DYGIDYDDGYLESDEDDSDSGSDSESESRRRKKKRETKRKRKEESKPEVVRTKHKEEEKVTVKPNGTAAEVTDLIRQLNRMQIDDAEYAPTYYSILALDQTGGGNRESPRPANNGAPLPPECFGCGKDDGHRMFDCVEIKELLQRGVVKHDENTGKLCMADGTFIRRRPGEYIAPAAR
ncbi:hypothetical protein R3P38DRAFT_2419111, partial [Favolaschia claudopus]